MSSDRPAHVIVVGNEKGGSGKSTVAMHIIVGLLRGGLKVATLDLDARQATLSLYLRQRAAYAEAHGIALPMPETHDALHASGDPAADIQALDALMTQARRVADVVVLDTPGSDTPLSRAGHGYADTLVTPLNDSFIDLAVLAKVDAQSLKISGLSHYAELVFEVRKQKALRQQGKLRWVVMRNRLSSLDAKNKRDMEVLVADLSKRLLFEVAPGLGERVIYRELFLKGLTLFDLRQKHVDVALSLSHVAARQELRHLLESLGFRVQ